jgi:hypothetical protein
MSVFKEKIKIEVLLGLARFRAERLVFLTAMLDIA